jgi:hypothetical protein
MSEVGKASGQGGNIARVTGWLVRLVRAAGDRLFQAEDIRASQNGWQITARRGGLARTYRDPRFDRFRNCPDCHGTGTSSAEKPCNRCDGTGRITVSQAPLADWRQG